MGDKPKLELTEQERLIQRDLRFARMKLLKAGDDSSVNTLPVHETLSESEARQILPVFDFFRSVYSGNGEAVKRGSR